MKKLKLNLKTKKTMMGLKRKTKKKNTKHVHFLGGGHCDSHTSHQLIFCMFFSRIKITMTR